MANAPTRDITDMMGRVVRVPVQPQRIVSLVPSQTELVCALGGRSALVGITKFCVHPEEVFRTVIRVGGTKNVDYDRIASLAPDLILCNREENNREIVETLAEHYPVWVSEMETVQHGIRMIEQLGHAIGHADAALALAANVRQAWAGVAQHAAERKATGTPVRRVLYLIWRGPYMAAGAGTYISDVLLQMGAENVATALDGRYPQVAESDLVHLAPTHIYLSSEPYPFKDKHLAELQALLPAAHIQLVDGELFSWYGSRMLPAAAYVQSL